MLYLSAMQVDFYFHCIWQLLLSLKEKLSCMEISEISYTIC